jgi:cation diffusion facilitator CzcD-associated flavoprotein CzcO
VNTETVDVLIVGAGLSGIGAACHLQMQCPDRQVAIVEARADLGGTWDLFRYPGIRSDSDMYTLGYSFKPWVGEKAIADGPSILQYLRDTAAQYGVDKRIRFGHRVQRADWSTADALWTVQIERAGGEVFTLRCNFLLMCSGYYRYDAGYTPEFAGIQSFAGRVVHPQHWPQQIELQGQRVVVIGSGATAVTLVPELAKLGAAVTLLQRSPTYMVSRPSIDGIARWLLRHAGPRVAHALARWKNVLYGQFIFNLARKRPAAVKARLIGMLKPQLPAGYDIQTHFTPHYNPWDQRICLVPDGDLFKCIQNQTVHIVTDQIDCFTTTGIRLKSGAELPADVVVTATGLQVQTSSAMPLRIDGELVDFSNRVGYKGMMFGGVPNFASVFGYTNASWTLKADLVSEFICRLLNHMRSHHQRQCMPSPPDPAMPLLPWIDFSSGYLQRVMHSLPKQGTQKPWKLNQNYLKDLMWLRHGSLHDGVMRFS